MTTLDEIGVTVRTSDLRPLSPLAQRYVCAPAWLRWLRPRARRAWRKERILRMMELEDAVMRALWSEVDHDRHADAP
ncbi:MAG: hypothetical protein JXC32_20655 [Anaerolineae bacterium]|nr:hypothetical protein [Anaerolineae bacterium]